MQIASSSYINPAAGTSSVPAGSSGRTGNEPLSQFTLLYQRNELAGPRVSLSRCAHLFAMSRLTGTPATASKNGYQLLAEVQRSTNAVLSQILDLAKQPKEPGPRPDTQGIQRIVDQASNTIRQRISDTRIAPAGRLEESLYQADTACNKYLARHSQTAENFLALHAAINACIAEFEAAAVQQPSGSRNDAALEHLYAQTRAALRAPMPMPTGGTQQRHLYAQIADMNAASAVPAGNRIQETDVPQVQSRPTLPATGTENIRQVPAATDPLIREQRFPEVDRILEEMRQGSMKWNSGTRFTAPTRQLRQLKEMLGRETETTAEQRRLREYILTRLVQAIDALPAEAAFTHEHRQMVVRLYQRVLHHENLPQHDQLFRLKTYRQLRVVERLDRLAETPADFKQDLLVSDASIGTILTGLLRSEKLSEFRGAWIDMAGHQLERLRRNVPAYAALLNTLYEVRSTAWLRREQEKCQRLLGSHSEWLRAQRSPLAQTLRPGTDTATNHSPHLYQHINNLVEYIETYMRNGNVPDILAISPDFTASLGEVLNDLLVANPTAYANLVGRVVNLTYARLNAWMPEHQQAFLDAVFSSINWHRDAQLFNDDGERMQFNSAINNHLRKLMRRVMSEVEVPPEQEDARQRQRQSLLAQLREKFGALRTANLEAHAQLLASLMRGWGNWPNWNADARDTLTNMVSEELLWIDENRRGNAEANPGLDFAHFSELAAEYTLSLAGQGPIAQIITPPDYVAAASEVRPLDYEAVDARVRADG